MVALIEGLGPSDLMHLPTITLACDASALTVGLAITLLAAALADDPAALADELAAG